MKSAKLKPAGKTKDVFELYNIFSVPGVCTPDEQGRQLFDPQFIRQLLNSPKMTAQSAWRYAKEISVSFYDAARRMESLKDIPRSTLINQHIDVAETILLHHIKKMPFVYKGYIEELENHRGYYFHEQTKADGNDAENAKQYAFWLIGRLEKMRKDSVKSQDEAAITAFQTDVETLLRKAGEAGHVDASEALASFLYSEKENVDEAMVLWEQAAAAGDENALHNLFNVATGDDSLTHEKKNHALMAIWEGAAANPEGWKIVAKMLEDEGHDVPEMPLEIPSGPLASLTNG